ncbi:cobalt-zinc-cadmium efflux system protein [Amaricoccus macauensis]|uniref:Cobalt-zinc-cadmium efflux system protein n=1 Tax=Amaricoccus macauensis TaxID=57001 RepID=A0A840SP48_9RHOB|nr:cation diffusion facilitator family transporter [Amaricoccus macauensis]MBB5222530.1 cobalt-zinc-cadmium efflux system protein [Amaricoccus macauensis]
MSREHDSNDPDRHSDGGSHRDHGHDHGDAHDHAGHSHHHVANAGNARAIGLAAFLTGSFMLVEVVGGLVAGSLTLLADAGHMATDFAALAMAWLAFRVARRPADRTRTYGFDRLAVMAAFINGIALFVVAGWIVIEAVRRLGTPHPVEGGLMLVVAAVGLLVNIAAFWVLSRGDRSNLNVRAAFLHVVSDMLGSVGAILAALIILATGWTPIDPILSVLVSVLILRHAWGVVRDSGHILLEGTPPDFDAGAVAGDLTTAVPEVREVRHLHAWSISEERPVVTLEALLAVGADPERTRQRVKARLAERFGFNHATVEVIAADGIVAEVRHETTFVHGELPRGGSEPI